MILLHPKHEIVQAGASCRVCNTPFQAGQAVKYIDQADGRVLVVHERCEGGVE